MTELYPIASKASRNSPLAPYNGDYNGNHVVDAADYVLWRKGLGTTYTQSDYYVWRSQYGQTVPGAGSGMDSHAAVPEPATATMLFIGMLLAFRRQRSKYTSTNDPSSAYISLGRSSALLCWRGKAANERTT